MAGICDLIGSGRIVTVDVEDRPGRPVHGRITYLEGSSTSDEVLEQVTAFVQDAERVMVILDSDHSRDHVLRELELYSPLVSKGCYLVVEDTNVNGHPVVPGFGPGPMEALIEFLGGTNDFEVDRSREKLMLTFNPSGYLLRVR
jgi:cephalosporin hydroxylase